MKSILCFGDSNTYGYIPNEGKRYPKEIRWTGILANKLGKDFDVIEEGLCGRTSVFYDPIEDVMAGSDYLPSCLKTHNPLDIIIIMLGTNDLKSRFSTNSFDIDSGIGRIIQITKQLSPDAKILAICPPPIKTVGIETLDNMFGEKGFENSHHLMPFFKEVTDTYNVKMLDSQRFVETSQADGLHFDEKNHAILAQTIFNLLFKLGWLN